VHGKIQFVYLFIMALSMVTLAWVTISDADWYHRKS